MTATTIDEVLAGLDAVVDDALHAESRIGYFAALYRTVTRKVHEGITTGFFDDPARMEQLDVVFANRYLDALRAHRHAEGPTQSWQEAFDAAARWRPTVLQHLLVAINAHINLDLGIAAAQVAPGDTLGGLRRDFDRINEILASLVAAVRANVAGVSPWIGLLDHLGSSRNDAVVNFSVVVARREAWRFANELAAIPAEQRNGAIRARDAQVAGLARVVLRPGILHTGLLAVRIREGDDVRRAIQRLGQLPPPALASVDEQVGEQRAP